MDCNCTRKSRIEKTITYIKDRPGHDKRYAIDANKLKSKLGWTHLFSLRGPSETIKWYLSNQNGLII